jgi:hypothetical protein
MVTSKIWGFILITIGMMAEEKDTKWPYETFGEVICENLNKSLFQVCQICFILGKTLFSGGKAPD